jgi:maleamate amidohydrolase
VSRVWDSFLTDRDRQALRLSGSSPRIGFGERPAVLLIDNFRGVLGKGRQPLLEAIATNPNAVGPEGWDAVEAQARLLEVARRFDVPVIHTTGASGGNIPGWGFCAARPQARGVLRGPVTDNSDVYTIVDEVRPTEREFVITKAAPSAFMATPLLGLLNFLAVDTLIMGGETTSGCVRATVVDATSYRFRAIVAEECVYDRTEASHAMSLFDLDRKYADVLPLHSILQYLERTSAGVGAT